MIESIFDVKRQALRALSSIKQQYTAALNAFINASINNLNQALVATQNGITLSKTLVADLASQVTIDNISEGITDAQDSINDVINDSLDNLNSTGNILLESLINTKMQIAEAAENFDSQDLVHNANLNLGLAVNATFQGVESVVEDLGVFDSLDTIIHSVGNVPLKLNGMIDSTLGEDSAEEDEGVIVEDPVVPEVTAEIIDSNVVPRQFGTQ